MNKSKRRTICQWAKYYGIQVLDPDGFDRNDMNIYRRYFTRAEFDKAVWRCTLLIKSKGKMGKEIRRRREWVA